MTNLIKINDEDQLLRLVWHSSDFSKDGKLKGSAFSRRDLIPLVDDKGERLYVSVDVSHLASKEAIDWRIDGTRSGTGSGRDKRIAPRFATFQCDELRSIEGDAGGLLFEVSSYPIQKGELAPDSPENLAHAGVCSLTAAPSTEEEQELKVNELRTKLIKSLKGIKAYEDVFKPD